MSDQFISCPCCGGKIRVAKSKRGNLRLEAVVLTKPHKPWVAKGSRLAAERAIGHICEVYGVTLVELQAENRDPSLAAVRRRAVQAAKDDGACGRVIGEILHRDLSTVNKLAAEAER